MHHCFKPLYYFKFASKFHTQNHQLEKNYFLVKSTFNSCMRFLFFDKSPTESTYCMGRIMYKWIASEKWNWMLKVKCRKKFGLVCQLLAEPAQILFYNSLLVYYSLSAIIHWYMIQAHILLAYALYLYTSYIFTNIYSIYLFKTRK